jgi:hypothetical protein
MGKPFRAFLVVSALIIISSLAFIVCSAKKIEVHPDPESIHLPYVSYPMNQWLNELREHENCPPEGIIDSNGLRSYGPFCFQRATFVRYSKIFHLPPAPVYDPTAQRALTILILETYPEGWSNWATSVGEIGKPPIRASGG